MSLLYEWVLHMSYRKFLGCIFIIMFIINIIKTDILVEAYPTIEGYTYLNEPIENGYTGGRNYQNHVVFSNVTKKFYVFYSYEVAGGSGSETLRYTILNQDGSIYKSGISLGVYEKAPYGDFDVRISLDGIKIYMFLCISTISPYDNTVDALKNEIYVFYMVINDVTFGDTAFEIYILDIDNPISKGGNVINNIMGVIIETGYQAFIYDENVGSSQFMGMCALGNNPTNFVLEYTFNLESLYLAKTGINPWTHFENQNLQMISPYNNGIMLIYSPYESQNHKKIVSFKCAVYTDLFGSYDSTDFSYDTLINADSTDIQKILNFGIGYNYNNDICVSYEARYTTSLRKLVVYTWNISTDAWLATTILSGVNEDEKLTYVSCNDRGSFTLIEGDLTDSKFYTYKYNTTSDIWNITRVLLWDYASVDTPIMDKRVSINNYIMDYGVTIGEGAPYSNGTISTILIDGINVPTEDNRISLFGLDEYIFPPPPDSVSVYINGKTDGVYWVFKNEVYNLTAVVSHSNLIQLNFTDTVHTIVFYYNNVTKVQRLYVYGADGTLVNENVANGIANYKTFNGHKTTLTWKFMLTQNIIDSYNDVVHYSLGYYNSSLVVQAESSLSFNIYNLGGLVSYTFNGDGNHVLGGSPFEIYATDSTLNSTAYAEIIYRRLQSVHMLVELNTDNKLEADHLEPLVNVGYYEVGFDYKLDGHEEDAWITGWSSRVYISEINVGTYGVFPDSSYVALTVLWYNNGDFIRGDQYIYSYHWEYDKTTFPTHRESITFWADLWFDKANSSTVFGGRINTEYYGYYEDGSSWWFGYGGFRPLIGNITASMIFGNIIDDYGNIIPSRNIGLVKFWEKVVKSASAGDADTYTVKPFQVFSVKVAQDRMDGIDTPVFIEPKQLNLGGYSIFDPLLGALGGIGSVISGALFGMGKVMIGGIDTILSWIGLPYGTFSGFISFVMVIFNSLISSLSNVISMISKSLTLLTTFITTIIVFVDYIISIILFFGVDIFSIPLQIIALFIAVLNGGAINFYGIPLDFTPYAPLMVALKTLLPPMGGIMLTVWIFWGNLSMSGEPDIIGAMQRIVQLFGMMRTLYTNIMWIFIRIRNELISIYNFLKSHIPGMGGGGGTIEEGGGTSG